MRSFVASAATAAAAIVFFIVSLSSSTERSLEAAAEAHAAELSSMLAAAAEELRVLEEKHAKRPGQLEANAALQLQWGGRTNENPRFDCKPYTAVHLCYLRY